MKQEDKELMRQDKPWFDAFMARHYPQKEERNKAKRKRIIWVSVCSCAAALAIVLTLILCLPKFKSSGKEERYYAMGNEEWAQTDIVSLNGDLQRVALRVSLESAQEIVKCYDTQYNDTLYYRLKSFNEDTIENVTVYVYTNEMYSNAQFIEGNGVTATVGAFTVQYTTACVEDEGIYTITHTAQSEYKGIRIYVEYEQMSLSEQSDLLEFFARTFQVK